MRSSNKSRSRNKNNNRNRNVGNIVNRVFDSAGPEGKVRGTPQQIIEKYQTLTRDAQLSGDRVAAENFQQHAEHYARMLGEAQREQAERQAEQQQRQQDQQNNNQNNQNNQGNQGNQNNQNGQQPQQQHAQTDPGAAPQPDVSPAIASDDNGPDLVETPETRANGGDQPKQRRPRNRKPKAEVIAEATDAPSDANTEPGTVAE